VIQVRIVVSYTNMSKWKEALSP